MANATTVLILTTVFLYLVKWKRQQKDLPPGPTKFPLIGNMFSMPPRLETEFFQRMSKQYDSDILHFDAAGQSILVLNSYEAAQELLDKRSGIYSGRPRLVMLNEVAGFGFQFSLWPYNDRWRAARRVFAQYFNRAEIYQPREVKYSRRLLQQLLEDPSKWYSHFQMLTASTSLEMTYGIGVQSADDPLVKVVDEGLRLSCDLASAGPYFVDVFPSLQRIPGWFPGASFQRIGAKLRPMAAATVDKPFQACLEIMKKGNYKPSYLTSALDELESNDESEEDVTLAKEIAAQVYMAGSDTTRAVLANFVAAMIMHPDLQQMAQKEVDSVLNDHLPDHNDLENLPFLTAIILETYRMRAVLPLGIPHMSTMEDVYLGYRIPSGTLIIPNQSACLYNEEIYPEPHKFNPERFLKGGKLDPEVRNPMNIAFGFGRRICPGRHIAHSTLMLTTASILLTFDIVKQLDVNGDPIEPVITYHDTTLCQPMEFPCDFKPRSPKAAELIRSLMEEI